MRSLIVLFVGMSTLLVSGAFASGSNSGSLGKIYVNYSSESKATVRARMEAQPFTNIDTVTHGKTTPNSDSKATVAARMKAQPFTNIDTVTHGKTEKTYDGKPGVNARLKAAAEAAAPSLASSEADAVAQVAAYTGVESGLLNVTSRSIDGELEYIVTVPAENI